MAEELGVLSLQTGEQVQRQLVLVFEVVQNGLDLLLGLTFTS